MADLVTLEYAQAMLPGFTGTRLAALPAAIEAASEAVRQLCRRDFEEAEAVELYDGDGTGSLTLDRYPVASIASVKTGADTDDPTTLDPTEYAFNPRTGELRFKSGIDPGWSSFGGFPFGWRNVEVTYTAGGATVPTPVQQATVQVARAMVDQALRDTTVDQERWGDFSWSRQVMRKDLAIPETAQQLLAPYINHRV